MPGMEGLLALPPPDVRAYRRGGTEGMIQDSARADCMRGGRIVSGPRGPSLSAASRGETDKSSAILVDNCWLVNLEGDAKVMELEGCPAMEDCCLMHVGQDNEKRKEGKERLTIPSRRMSGAVTRMRFGT